MGDALGKALLSREGMLICPAPGTSREAIEDLLAEDFCEVGASGRICTRAGGIEALLRRAIDPPSEPWALSDYEARRLSDEICLATYILDWAGRESRRATIWRRSGGVWLAAYHQGTAAGGGT